MFKQQYKLDQNLEYIKKRIDRKMPIQPNSQTSLETISIKFTESNLPSSSLIKLSQDHISLTYTISLQNISTEKIEFPEIQELQDLSTSIERQTLNIRNDKQYKKNYQRQKDSDNGFNKEVFKKKSILKISNLDFSALLDSTSTEQSQQFSKSRKSFLRNNNSGLFYKTKNMQDSVIRNKNYSKSKDICHVQPFQNFLQGSQTRASRFFSLKNDKSIEPTTNCKKIFSIKRQSDRKIQNFQTDRKYNRLPIIKGSNFHSSAPASLNRKRKVLSCYENAETLQRNPSNLNEKVVLGKTFKMSENDDKAKKYLQKVIQNRNSIIHFSESKRQRITKEYKENLEEWF